MRIVLTGGGSGGHFYPLLAVADAIAEKVSKDKLVPIDVWYISDSEFDKGLLYDHGIKALTIPTGKLRRYFSIQSVFDLLKTLAACVRAVGALFKLYPDVVFGKGGYASFPTLLAARILNIPVVIHESDTVPGMGNKWAGKFARRIAVSYPEAARFFPQAKVAWTGNPIRHSIIRIGEGQAPRIPDLDSSVPTILVIGGSLGAQRINETLLDALPALTERCNIVHQTGKSNFEEFSRLSAVALQGRQFAGRYKSYAYLDDSSMRAAASVASIVVTRAGSALFEIAAWGVPAIVIPISDSNGDHQRQNAFAYARSGAAIVIEEENLTPHIFADEILRLLANADIRAKMSDAARGFARLDAADLIARELVALCLKHES